MSDFERGAETTDRDDVGRVVDLLDQQHPLSIEVTHPIAS
jgi:hypothetical protein